MEIDEDLVNAARAGDRRAREALGRWLNDELFSFFSKRFEVAEIDDMLQQTVEDVLKKLPRYKHGGAEGFRRWVLRFASFEAKTKTREPYRQRDRERKVREQPVSPMLSPDSLIYGGELEEHVEQCMKKLSAHEREALEHWQAGGSDEELAARAGVSISTISSRRHRARERLKALLAVALATPVPQPSSSPSSSSPTAGD